MSVRLFLLVIMICPVTICLAGPSTGKIPLFIAGNELKPGVVNTLSMMKSDLRTGAAGFYKPVKRSVRRTYSKKRINRRWRRSMRLKTVRAKSVLKFEVPANGNLAPHVAMNGNIEKWKAHLPWPVPSGTVSMRFGLYEVLKGINHNSNGITIETTAGIPVTAVFGGYVQNVFTVADQAVVMIRHGKYFTTYSNLATVSVCKDDPVITGQILGQVAENGQLDFIISDKTDKYFDPEKWLKK
jgi:septal ring factor EnvC (AmiA/AmiB activator)